MLEIVDIIIMAVFFLIGWIISAFIFWLAGRAVSGINTTFTDALIVALVRNIANTILQWVFTNIIDPMFISIPMWWIISLIIQIIIVLIVYIPLIMKFFDTSFWGAIAVGLLVIIITVVIGIVIGAILIGVLILLLAPLFP